MDQKNSEQKIIFVTVFHSLVSKNILNTDAITLLRDSGNYKLVLLVPTLKKEFFERHYGHPDVCVEGIDMHSVAGKLEEIKHTLARLLIRSHYLHYKRREFLDSNPTTRNRIRYVCSEFFARTCGNKAIARIIFRHLDSLSAKKNTFRNLFESYRPTLVFSTDLFEQTGAQLLREAKMRKIKTVGMVRSWDNCYSKGLLRIIPDIAIVNNLELKQELISLHGVTDAKIEVVGLPQFDSFVSQKPEERSVFFKKHGLDPNKRIVMFAPAGKILSDTDPDICKILIEAKERGVLPPDIQFFVRNHPQHPANLDVFTNIPGMHIESPGVVLDKRNDKETELTPDNQNFLRNILAHVDILIWVATSLCLDALVYDVPEIVVNFDGYKSKEYYDSVKRYHDEDHMKKMFALKPFRVANTPEELVQHVLMYLHNKTLDNKERDAVRVQQLFRLDGKSGERIKNILERILC